MGRPDRLAVYAVIGGVWLSGCLWLVLDQFFSVAGQFGTAQHPWQPWTLKLHGVAAVIALYLLGWVSARHVVRWWPGRRRRVSGTTLASCLGLLSVSGFALFFLTDEGWQRTCALAHDALGVAVTAIGIQHGFFVKRRDMRSAASRP